MFRIALFISILSCLISCMRGGHDTVEIIGKDPTTSEIRIRGMGVRLPDGSILTSDHVVRDDMRYEVGSMKYEVLDRDIGRDIAVLLEVGSSRGNIHHSSFIIHHSSLGTGDTIYTEVSRSGSIVKQVGKVVDPSGSITGYDTTGRVVTLSGILLTDLDLLPGDSGAPIYTLDRELVDVVHVR